MRPFRINGYLIDLDRVSAISRRFVYMEGMQDNLIDLYEAGEWQWKQLCAAWVGENKIEEPVDDRPLALKCRACNHTWLKGTLQYQNLETTDGCNTVCARQISTGKRYGLVGSSD